MGFSTLSYLTMYPERQPFLHMLSSGYYLLERYHVRMINTLTSFNIKVITNELLQNTICTTILKPPR